MAKKKKQNAFNGLLTIAEHCLKHASGLPAQVDITPHWSGVGFQLMGQRFVAPLGEVIESIDVPNFTRIPGVQSWIKGVANVRGRLLPIMDLSGFFNYQIASNVSGRSKRNRRVLIIENGDIYTGLMVEEVYGMQHFPIDTFSKAVPDLSEDVMKYLKGSYIKDGVQWVVFSPNILSQSEKFIHAELAS